MFHSVGEPKGFDISMLKRAAELARQDEERSAYLADRCRIVTREDSLEPAVCDTPGCGTVLHENARGTKCRLCIKRMSMQKARRWQGEREVKGKTITMTVCVVCGTEIRKWGPNGNLRKCCDGCVDEAKRKVHIKREA